MIQFELIHIFLLNSFYVMEKKVLFGIGAGLVLVAAGVVAYIKREAVKELADDVYVRVKNKLAVGGVSEVDE